MDSGRDEPVSVPSPADDYDSRYEQGYMSDWPERRKRRVAELIGELGLPRRGAALDFGCGSGVFTAVLARALPEWSVHGADISAAALRIARQRLPQCSFSSIADPELLQRRFDLVFTHHVLEHVEDLDGTCAALSRLTRDRGTVLHILPGGNPGSFGHTMALLRTDGVDRSRGNRFFFEDPAHLRRLTSDELVGVMAAHGFALANEYYDGGLFTALDYWTTEAPDRLELFYDTSTATSPRAAAEMRRIVRPFKAVAAAQRVVRRYEGWIRGHRRLRSLAGLCLLLPAYCAAKSVTTWVRSRADAEWRRQRQRLKTGEMYLHFVRTEGAAPPAP